MNVAPVIRSFNAGELSPLLDGRSDLAKYQAGCRILKNMLPTPYGAAVRRPGTKFVGKLGLANAATRIVPFMYSTDEVYILVFVDGYMHVAVAGDNPRMLGWVIDDLPAWSPGNTYYEGEVVKDGGLAYICVVEETSGTTNPGSSSDWLDLSSDEHVQDPGALTQYDRWLYTIPTPYTDSDLADLQYAQINDVMWLVHANHPVHKLMRYAEDRWVLSEVGTVGGPFAPENDDETITLACSVTTGTGTLTASSGIFTEAMVGSLMRLSHYRAPNAGHSFVSAANWSTGAPHTTAELRVVNGYEVITHGTWTGSVWIQERIGADGDWENVRMLSSNDDKNYLITEDADEPNLYVRAHSEANLDASFGIKISSLGNRVDGIVKITGYTSPTQVAVDVVEDLYSTDPTPHWAEGAWNGRRGYPAAIEISANRLVFGGTPAQPQTVWRSAVDDYTNFRTGTRDDDSDSYTLASGTQNGIRWIKAFGSALVIGTRGGEHILRPAEGEVLTATNLDQEQQSSYGSAAIQAVMLHDAVFFVERDGDGVRAMKYRFETDSYAAQDATILAEHIAEVGIRSIAVQTQPMGILWCVLNDGTLASLTYEPFHDVQAWSRHDTQGTILGVAVVPTTSEDQVWLAVERAIDKDDPPNTAVLLEYLGPLKNNTDIDLVCCVDSAMEYHSATTPKTTLRLARHIRVWTIDVLADGVVYKDLPVDAYGDISLPQSAEAKNVVGGLPFESILCPMRADFSARVGDTSGRVQRAYEVAVSLHETQKPAVGTVEGSYRDVVLGADAEALWSGVHVEPVGDEFDREGRFYVVQRNPLPLTVRSLALHLEFADA